MDKDEENQIFQKNVKDIRGTEKNAAETKQKRSLGRILNDKIEYLNNGGNQKNRRQIVTTRMQNIEPKFGCY